MSLYECIVASGSRPRFIVPFLCSALHLCAGSCTCCPSRFLATNCFNMSQQSGTSTVWSSLLAWQQSHRRSVASAFEQLLMIKVIVKPLSMTSPASLASRKLSNWCSGLSPMVCFGVPRCAAPGFGSAALKLGDQLCGHKAIIIQIPN